MANENERRAFYHVLFPRKDENKGMTARVPDANETRLNLNFKIISDEFKKLWDFIKNGFKTKSLTVDGDASVVGQLSAGSAALGDTSVNGVLDVTPRRCYATLSSAGWYRVCTFNRNLLYTGGIVKFRIILYSGSGSANHEITLSCIDNGAVWRDESSNGNANISKIRLTKETGDIYYVDIYYQLSVARSVDVFFEPYLYNPYLNVFTAESLQSVADAPSGETILTTYDFSANLSPTYLKYVDSEAATYTVGSNHYVAVPYPSGLNGRNVVSIGMVSWTSVTGAISIMPYGNTNVNWYIIGEAGVTLTNVVFRYWYI